jgi:hypothetical protein
MYHSRNKATLQCEMLIDEGLTKEKVIVKRKKFWCCGHPAQILKSLIGPAVKGKAGNFGFHLFEMYLVCSRRGKNSWPVCKNTFNDSDQFVNIKGFCDYPGKVIFFEIFYNGIIGISAGNNSFDPGVHLA